jgi:hypothetical protein
MRKPNKTVTMPCALPLDLRAFLEERAALDMRSMNSVLVEAVRKLKESAQREERAAG